MNDATKGRQISFLTDVSEATTILVLTAVIVLAKLGWAVDRVLFDTRTQVLNHRALVVIQGGLIGVAVIVDPCVSKAGL